MKFACLVYIDEEIAGRMTPEEHRKLTDRTIEEDWRLRREGRLILSQPLESPERAVTIRGRGGRLARTDGPFAETKEFLGGFYLIEARDLDEAIEIVGRDPMVEMGRIEIRPYLDQTHSATGRGRPPLLGSAGGL
ncbi:MAG TPA: YciI family protein [Bauldia sp.]|nr:YciI family protein [Bauldia sp.]